MARLVKGREYSLEGVREVYPLEAAFLSMSSDSMMVTSIAFNQRFRGGIVYRTKIEFNPRTRRFVYLGQTPDCLK